MSKRFTSFLYVAVIFFLVMPCPAWAWSGKVIGVADGDTITVLRGKRPQKIRLYGIDTPEKGQPYGQTARKYLASLIAGSIVDIETVNTDRYGRTVGIVTDGNRDINQEMVKAGYAWVYRRYCDKPFCEYWISLESEAKADKKGLWQEPDPVPPWEWRRRK